MHLVIGTAGADFTKNAEDGPPVSDLTRLSEYMFTDLVAQAWSELVFYRHGYSRITAVDANNLLYEWVDNSDGRCATWN